MIDACMAGEGFGTPDDASAPAGGGGAKKGKQPAYVRTGGWRLPPLGRAPTLKECVHLWEEQVRKRASRAREGVLSAMEAESAASSLSVSLARGRGLQLTWFPAAYQKDCGRVAGRPLVSLVPAHVAAWARRFACDPRARARAPLSSCRRGRGPLGDMKS